MPDNSTPFRPFTAAAVVEPGAAEVIDAVLAQREADDDPLGNVTPRLPARHMRKQIADSLAARTVAPETDAGAGQ